MKHVIFLAALLTLAACGSSEEGLDASADPDGSRDDQDVQLDVPRPPQPLTIAVTFAALEQNLGHLGYDSDGAPVEGATVAVDRPDGTRIETTTDASGEVELEPIDWSAGDVIVTVYLEGYRMRTWVLDEAPEDNTLNGSLKSLSPSAPIDMVTVSGTIRNGLPAEANYRLYVRSDQPVYSAFEEREVRWSLQVPRDTPFRLLAYQYDFEDGPGCQDFDRPHGFFALLEHPAVSEPTTDVVIDFEAHRVTPQTVAGSFHIPTRANSLMASHGWGHVLLVDERRSGVVTVSSSRMRFDAAAGRYDFELNVITELSDVPMRLQALVREGCDGSWSGFEGDLAWQTSIFGSTVLEGDLGPLGPMPIS